MPNTNPRCNRRPFPADVQGMTALPSHVTVEDHLPAMPLPAVPLTYGQTRDKLPPLVRIGGVIGFIGLSLTLAMLPVWNPLAFDAGRHYILIVTAVVPILQLICFGSGVTLIWCGRLFYGRRRHPWEVLPLLIHLLLLMVASMQVRDLVSTIHSMSRA
jgi:hypothetical protein